MKPKALPEKTQSSLTKGLWFVHNDGLNTIKIFGSTTGKEKVYLNEELVSERRSLKLKSEHHFQDKEKNEYEVKFNTINLIKGEMDCLIIKNNEVVKSFKTTFNRGKNFTLKRFLILIVSCFIFALLKVYFEWPKFTFYIFLGLLLIIQFKTFDPGKITVNEDE